MLRYIIESPHTKDECLKALDEILAEGPAILNKFDWGCAAGDHTGYAVVDAENESTVRSMVPNFLRYKTKIMQVSKFTPEQIKSFH
ncbi:MAG: hypothetical protein HZA08_03670 [Nitrospirae bacterium]|nr:hypothetical protein [Nitrospirota bacterium]